APMIQHAAERLANWIDNKKPAWGARGLSGLLERARDGARQIAEISKGTHELFDLFMPFILENKYTFSCESIRRLYAQMSPEDREKIPWDPERIDWRHYWLDIHMEGLKTWVFPSLEEEFAERARLGKKTRIYTYRDLLEMFEAATRR